MKTKCIIYVSKVWINSVLKLFRPRISHFVGKFSHSDVLSIQKKKHGRRQIQTHTLTLTLNRKCNISHSKNSSTRLANKCGSFFERIRLAFDSWNRHHNIIWLWLWDSKKNSFISLSLERQDKVSLLFLFRLLFFPLFVLKFVFVPQIPFPFHFFLLTQSYLFTYLLCRRKKRHTKRNDNAYYWMVEHVFTCINTWTRYFLINHGARTH